MIQQFLSCVGKYKKDAILTPIFVALEVLMDVIIPLFLAQMIDDGISGGSMPVIVKTGLVLVLACSISLLGGVVAGRTSARASAGFARNLRDTMFDKIQDFSFTNVDRFSTTSLVTRLTTDVTNVQNAFQMIIRICARAPLMILFSVIQTFRVNSQLAWVFVAAVPVLGLGLGIIMAKTLPLFSRVFKRYDHLNGIVQENVRGMRVVKSYVREDFETKKFQAVSGEIHDDFVHAEKILAFNSPLMQFCMYTCTLLVCWLGAKLIVGGTFTTGQLMSLFTYAVQILMSLMMLSMVFVMVTMSEASAIRITQVLAEESDMKHAQNPVSTVANGSIAFQNVSFGYRGKDGKQCLSDITLSVESGQTVGIIGGTGSGKSSLVQLIPRLYDVSAGTVQVGGVDVRQYDLATLRDAVAMVLQKNILFAGTVRDNLRWGKQDATNEEMEHVCVLAQADQFIRAFPDGYDTWIDQGASNVSGGQKQRLCIARALLKKPKILILDDSTSAVDTKTDAQIRKAFREELPGTTKLIIAQRISSVQDADCIFVLDNGTISAAGIHEELLDTSSIYQEIYQSQQKGGLQHDAA